MAKNRTNEEKMFKIIVDFNSQYKINTHESIDINNDLFISPMI